MKETLNLEFQDDSRNVVEKYAKQLESSRNGSIWNSRQIGTLFSEAYRKDQLKELFSAVKLISKKYPTFQGVFVLEFKRIIVSRIKNSDRAFFPLDELMSDLLIDKIDIPDNDLDSSSIPPDIDADHSSNMNF